MDNQIPKYHFKKNQHLDFEITSIRSIYKNSKSKLIFPHRQDFYGIFYFTNNYGKFFIDFIEYEIRKGSIFFISNEQVHYFSEIDKTNGTVILFTNSFLEDDYLIEKVFEQNEGLLTLLLNSDQEEELKILFAKIESIYRTHKKMKREILKKYLEILLLEIYQNNQNNTLSKNISLQRFIKFKKDLKKHYKISKIRSKAIPRDPLISINWLIILDVFNATFKSSKVL